MKMKFLWVLLLACIIMFAAIPAQAMATPNKIPTDYTDEYAKWGVIKQDNIFYYEGTRIRIFHDMKSDNSFQNSAVDIEGTVDIRLLRNVKGEIKELEFIPTAEANEIFEDLFGYIPPIVDKPEIEYTNIERCELQNVPTNIQNAITSQCTDSKWYIMKTSNRQYLYYKNPPRDFAYQIEGENLNIRDIGKPKNIYVLLSVGVDFDFKLFYNQNLVEPINLVIN